LATYETPPFNDTPRLSTTFTDATCKHHKPQNNKATQKQAPAKKMQKQLSFFSQKEKTEISTFPNRENTLSKTFIAANNNNN
jgi:hypothetical protein